MIKFYKNLSIALIFFVVITTGVPFVFAQIVPADPFGIVSGQNYIKAKNVLYGLQIAGIATSTTGCLGINSSGWISASGTGCFTTQDGSFSTTSAAWWVQGVKNPFTAASFVATSTATSTFSGGFYASQIAAPYLQATSTTASTTLQNFSFTQGQGTGLSLSQLTVSGTGTSTNLLNTKINGNLEITNNLSVGFVGTSMTQFIAPYFTATSSTQTSTFTAAPTFSSLTSAIVLTGAGGLTAEYTGATCTNQFVRSLDALGAATCATVVAGDVSLANLTATDTTLTFSGTYNGSTARTIGLNLGNANTWTALQTFSGNASSTQLTVTGNTYLATASGNVGVGTANPAYKLDVSGALNIAQDVLLTGGGLKMAYRSSTINYQFSGTGSWRVNNNADNVSLMTILDGGNVGIGTTSPTALLSLDTTAGYQLKWTRNTAGANQWGFSTDASGTYWNNVSTGGVPLSILNGGNVGIGTTDPGQLLEVYSTTEAGSKLRVKYSGSGGKYSEFGVSYAAPNYGTGIWTQGTQQANFYNGGMSLGSYMANDPPANGLIISGNVGIGTTSPAALLAVGSNAISSGGFYVNGTSGNVGIGVANPSRPLELSTADAWTALRITASTGTNSSSVYFSNSGSNAYVGVDDSTGSKLSAGSYATILTGGGNVGIGAGNALKMVVTTAGNVGIGETAPDTILHIKSSAPTIKLENTAGTGNPGVNIHNSSDTLKASFGYATASDVLFAGYAGNTHLVINSSGNVGIGTTSPGKLLDVRGTNDDLIRADVSSGYGAITLSAGATAKLQIGYAGSSSNYGAQTIAGDVSIKTNNTNLHFVTGSGNPNTSMYISTAGNVGIGTTSPFTRFGVDTGGSGVAYGGAYIYNSPNSSNYSVLGIQSNYGDGDGTGVGRLFSARNSTGFKMVIDNTGNVGIGTTAPGFKLEVSQSVNTPAAATIRMTGFADDNISTLNLRDDTAQATGVGGRIAFQGLNDVGSYTSFATIQGAKLNGDAGNNAGVMIFKTQPSGGILTERMRIDNTGNVGIGTTSPFRLLSVAGTSVFTGTILATGLTGATAGTNQDVCITTAGNLINETTGTCTVSSRRYKHSIKDLTVSGLDLINQLRPVSFSMNDDDVSDYKNMQYGLVAEEVADVDPHFAKYGTDGLPRTLDDRGILSTLVKAVQEIWDYVSGQDEKIAELEARIKALETRK